MKKRVSAAVLATGILALCARGQDGSRTVVLDDFESDLAGWTAMKVEEGVGFGPDGDSKVAITRDPQHVKSGKGALVYSYEIGSAAMRMLTIQRPKDLTGMKSLRFWVKCTSATAVMVGLNETGGANFQCAAYCPAGAWQEVALNLDELAVDNPAPGQKRTLDLDLVESFHLVDLGSFLVRMLPDIKGPRLLWLDDVCFSSQSVPQSTGFAKSEKGAPIYLVDNFESPVIRWAPVSFEVAAPPRVSLFDAPLSVDADPAPGGGKQSLKMVYMRQPAKIQGMIRNLEKIDLSRATGVELSLKTSRNGTFMVNIQEKGGARYEYLVELKAGDGWKKLSLALTDFKLAQDSHDDNGKLDADQIKEISLADVSSVLPGAAAATGVENVFRVDDVQFPLKP